MTSENSDSPPKQSRLKLFFTNLFKNNSTNSKLPESEPDYSAISELDMSKQDMIKGIISLSSKNTREIMIPRVDVIAVNENILLKDLVKVVDDAGHSRIPVFVETIDNITGILYVKDLLRFIIYKPKKFDLRKILHQPYFVPETMSLDDLLVEFKQRKLHLACVVEEYGGFAGIVTLEDILEEIVGEISDEFDEEKPPEVIKISTDQYEIDSRMTLTDLNNQMNINLPTEEFDTLGGFVFDLFGKVPKKNEKVKYETMIFKIKDITGTRINRIILSIKTSSKASSKAPLKPDNGNP